MKLWILAGTIFFHHFAMGAACAAPANAPQDCLDWWSKWCSSEQSCKGLDSQDNFACVSQAMNGNVDQPADCTNTLADPAAAPGTADAKGFSGPPNPSPGSKTPPSGKSGSPSAPSRTSGSSGSGKPSGSRNANSSNASSDIQSDIDDCNQALQQGQNTCNQDQSASSQVYGNNSMYSNQVGAQNLNNAAGNCSYAAQACKNACGGAASSWQSSCNDSCNSNIKNGINTLNNMNNSCNSLSNQAQNMANQANQAMSNAANNLNHNDNNNSNNNSMQPLAQQTDAPVDCTNPVARAASPDKCGVAPSPAAAAVADQSTKPSFPQDNPGASANVASRAAASSGVFPPLDNSGKDPGTQNQGNPRGPGMMGAGGMGMGMGLGQDGGGSQSGPRVTTVPGYYQRPADANVLKGERAGGGAATAAGTLEPEKVDRKLAGAGGVSGVRGGRADDLARMRGLDLKRYLPGGDRFPAGRMGGISKNPEIYSSNVNIFQVVSARFQEHCKLQLLFDCR